MNGTRPSKTAGAVVVAVTLVASGDAQSNGAAPHGSLDGSGRHGLVEGSRGRVGHGGDVDGLDGSDVGTRKV